jgi:23S rRNA (uracil1939-C5)-methyltransferase
MSHVKGRAMQWPDELELDLTSIAQGGDAVGRWEGRAVFAAGGLPGERVRVRLRDRQRSYARGDVIAVLDPAAERVESPCPLEGSCGAAGWRWIDHAAQRRFKAAILREQFRHLAGVEIAVADPPAPEPHEGWGYRATAELHVAGDRIGYYAPGTRRVADVPACCLHHPLINEALTALRQLPTHNVDLRGVTIRCAPAGGETIAILDGRGDLVSLVRAWRDRCPALVGVTAAPRHRLLDGRDWIEQRVGDSRFHVSAGSFFQINAHMTPRLVARVGDLLELDSRTQLLDLYCGVGLFALSFAPRVASVRGIEEWTPAIDDARRSARLNAIRNARFESGPAERLMPRLTDAFDRAVLDPPRRGCAPEVLDALAAIGPPLIVYVACHPGTLARDCKRLIAAGYRVAHAETIDMFPQTHHVESIVQLRRDEA